MAKKPFYKSESKIKTKERSKYGKGLVICLCKFVEHRPQLDYWLRLFVRMRQEAPSLFEKSHAIGFWANAASDHLYDIEAPKRWEKITNSIRSLQMIGLRMGHGFTGELWTLDDALALVQRAFKISKEIGFPCLILLKLSKKFSIHNFNLDRPKTDRGERVRHRIYWEIIKIIHIFAWLYDWILGLKPDIGEW